MKRITALIVALCGAALFAAAGDNTLDTTANALFFHDNPRAELASKETVAAIELNKKELGAVLQKFVVESAYPAFYSPEWFRRGVASVTFQDSLEDQLKAKLDANGVLQLPTGIPAIDAFTTQWHVTEYRRRYNFSKSFDIAFSPDVNPFFVTDALRKLSEVRYAQPSQLSFIGGGTEVIRLSTTNYTRNRQPTVYVLAVGWGDCPAGCMAVHRLYVEAITNFEGVHLRKVGETGPEFQPGEREKYLKP